MKGSEKSPHQEAPLSEIFHPREMLEKMLLEGIDKKGGTVLFSATIPTKAGLVSGDSYDPGLEGPLLRRSIRHECKVKILSQYLYRLREGKRFKL